VIPLETPNAHQITCGDCGSALIVGRPAGACDLCEAVVCTWCAEKHRCACQECGKRDARVRCGHCGLLLCRSERCIEWRSYQCCNDKYGWIELDSEERPTLR